VNCAGSEIKRPVRIDISELARNKFAANMQMVRIRRRLCENSDAPLSNPVLMEFSLDLSDQRTGNRKNSVPASPFSAQT
jgi:hypothetical protein